MPCVREDGSLSGSGRSMLEAVQREMTAAEVAVKIGMPLYLVRSGLREMIAAGYVSEAGELFSQTEQGAEKAKQAR